MSAATLQAITAQLAATRALLQRPPAGHHPRSVVITSAAPAPQAAATDGPVMMLPLSAIRLDPARFQFRLAAGADGVCRGRLDGCSAWNQALAGAILVWADPCDGSRWWLLDGHHRLQLAKRDGVEAIAALAVEAPDAAAARVLASVANVANNTAETVDFARLVRDQGLAQADLCRLYGLKRQTRTLADALALQELAEDLFSTACTGQLSLDHALALAAAADQTLQHRLAAMASQRGWDAPQLVEAVALAQLGPLRPAEAPAGTLPGLEQLMVDANPLIDQQLAVRAAIRRGLRLERRAVKIAAHRQSAAALERRGVAAVDLEQAAAVKAEAECLEQAFGRLAGTVGPLAELIAQLAAQVADGADVNRQVDAEMDRIRGLLAAQLS